MSGGEGFFWRREREGGGVGGRMRPSWAAAVASGVVDNCSVGCGSGALEGGGGHPRRLRQFSIAEETATTVTAAAAVARATATMATVTLQQRKRARVRGVHSSLPPPLLCGRVPPFPVGWKRRPAAAKVTSVAGVLRPREAEEAA